MSRTAEARRALTGLSADELNAAAAHLPEPLAAALRQLAGAGGGPEGDAALERALGRLAEDEAALRGRLGALERDLGHAGQDLASGVAALEALARQLSGSGGALAAAMDEALVRAPDLDPALAEALRQSAASARGLGDPAVLGALGGLGQLAAGLGPALARAANDPQGAQQVADQVLALEAAMHTLEQAAGAAEGSLRGLEEASQALAEEHPAQASALALARAELGEAAGQDSPIAWERALQAALAAGDLDAARRAGQKAAMAALAAGDYTRAAVVSHRVGDLAARQQDRRAEVHARLEEALALARLPEHRGSAKMLLAGAQATAAGDAELSARVRLVHGQTLEQWGEGQAAWALLRGLVADTLPDPQLAGLAGRAALSLGRLALADGRHHAAREQLGLALTLGRAGGEWMLYAPALSALLELALSSGDRAGVRALLRDGLTQAPRLGGPAAREALEGMVQALIARHGAELLQEAPG